MNGSRIISDKAEEAWRKLSGKWQGEDAEAFHMGYVIRISEIVSGFEEVCGELESASDELLQELKMIEQTMLNQSS